MKIVVAPDSFKGSLSAFEAAAALASGLRRALPGAELDLAPLADGGEGTARVLVEATGGTLELVRVSGPLGDPVDAELGLLGDGVTAVVEVASASGLTRASPERRDPLRATSRGTGELVLAALGRGRRRVIVALGGSATVDGGAGLASALGFVFRDASGAALLPGGGALAQLDRIERVPLPEGLELIAACDVTNRLLGPQGAAAVYGPQKGADPAGVARLEAGLERLAHVIERDLQVDVRGLEGGGAAGGLGAGLAGLLGATLEPGFQLVQRAIGLEERLRGARLVVTGEGRLDAQTANAKAPLGVARLARALGVPAVVVAGSVEAGAEEALSGEFARVFDASQGLPLPEAIARAAELLREAGERVGSWVRAGGAG